MEPISEQHDGTTWKRGQREECRHLLSVDEEAVRPRANSDPTVGGGFPFLLPEITIEDFTDSDSNHHHHGIHHQRTDQDEGGLFGMDATPRRRANTCPEDLFRKKSERPPTPPPGTFRKVPGRLGKFKSGLALGKPVAKESVSFAHHRLTKLAEAEGEEASLATSSHKLTSSALAMGKRASFSGFSSEKVEVSTRFQRDHKSVPIGCCREDIDEMMARMARASSDTSSAGVTSSLGSSPTTTMPSSSSSSSSTFAGTSSSKIRLEKKDSGCCSCKSASSDMGGGCGEDAPCGGVDCEGHSCGYCDGCQDNSGGHGDSDSGCHGDYDCHGCCDLTEIIEEETSEGEEDEDTKGENCMKTNSSSSSHCGLSHAKPRGIDSTQLQAC